jgi:hypothetical protein
MGIQLDLTINRNWQPIYETDRYASPVEGEPNAYNPIPPIRTPIRFETPYLLVRGESSTAKSRWTTAGWAEQEFSVGGSTSGGRPLTSFIGNREWVPLRKHHLLTFPDVGSDYALVFSVPWWMTHIHFEVWEYSGPATSDVEELLQTIKVDLLRIEAKINALHP